jgi:hypothetical protein
MKREERRMEEKRREAGEKKRRGQKEGETCKEGVRVKVKTNFSGFSAVVVAVVAVIFVRSRSSSSSDNVNEFLNTLITSSPKYFNRGCLLFFNFSLLFFKSCSMRSSIDLET